MNTNFKHTALRGALLGVVLGLTACVNSLELATPNGRNRSQDREQAIREAVAYFDNHRALLTRAAEAEPSEEAPFVVGDIVVDWESAVTVSNEEKRYTDFTMRKDNRFYLLLEQEGEQMEAVEIYSRFASVEDFGLDTMNQYVATYIPDVDYLQTYRNVAHEEGINCAEWYEFSGVVMYTMLSGHYVAAYRYDGGTLTERAFLYDREQTSEENIADFCSVMEGVTLGVAVEQEGTRAIIPDIIWIDPNSNVMYVYKYIGSYSHLTEYDPLSPEDYEVVEPEWENREGAGGGGGGSASTKDEEISIEKFTNRIVKNTLSPTDSAQLHTMLSEIIKDCMGKQLLSEIYNKSIPIEIRFVEPSIYQSNSQYKRSSNIYNCGIFMVNDHSEGLVHELFHFYQQLHSDYDSFTNAMVNYEIEAHLLALMYMSHTANSSAHSRYDSFCNTPLGEHIASCAEFINSNGTIYGSNNKEIEMSKFYFEYYFNDAAEFYKNRFSNKKYDTTRTTTDNIIHLQHLFKHCD